MRYDRRNAPYAIPSVMRLQPETSVKPKVKLTPEWQQVIFEMNWKKCPWMTEAQAKQAFRSLLAGHRAYTNGSSWDDPKHPEAIYADFVNDRDTDAPLPELHQPLVCSGASLKKNRQEGNKVYIDILDGTKPPPSVEFIMNNPHLYHYCLSVPKWPTPLEPLEPFPQFYPNTIMPNVAGWDVWYDVNRLMEVEYVPSPLTVHKRYP